METLAWILALTLAGAPRVESICLQVAPTKETWTRSAEQTRAVVLIHGYYVHILDKNVAKAQLRAWQKSDSALVKELSKNADVFVFGYGQNAPLDTIVKESKLGANIAELRKLGYTDICLIGHSAGGLIARHFVEDNPRCDVTKVVQVCAPNGGSPLAVLTAPKSQKPFMECLSTEHRKKCMEQRGNKRIPDHIEFVCVIAHEKNKQTDGVVPCHCQWTPDLQKQGVPAISVVAGHREVVRDAQLAKSICSLVCEKQDRWSAKRVEEAKKEFFGK
jgi:hypothetical protein